MLFCIHRRRVWERDPPEDVKIRLGEGGLRDAGDGEKQDQALSLQFQMNLKEA